MKKSILLTTMVMSTIVSFAQDNSSNNIGIGTRTPNASAILDLSASDKGLLVPRLTSNQKLEILKPAEGLLIFQTNDITGFYFFDGKVWKPLNSGEANSVATVDANGWALDGNAISNSNKTAATSASFIGTPNNIPINFKIGDARAGSITSGNLFMGYNSGNPATTGYSLTGIGAYALSSVTSGHSNVAIGHRTLTSTTTGGLNLAIGAFSLKDNINGSQNIGLGYYSLEKNTSGNFNLAIGTQSLRDNTTGNNNVAIGITTLAALTSGGNNVGVGFNSIVKSTSGSNNTAIGRETLFNSLSGSGNVALGNQAGYNEAGSNKLYIANTSTATPLVYGDFSAKFLSIGDVPIAKRDAVASSGQYSLIVEKGILSEKLKVALKSSTDWADYVFEPEYKANMMSLEEVERFTLENKHLPNVPSAEQLVEKGLDFNDTSRMFMEKIEELTLYLIELNKEVKALKAENELLKKK